MLAIDLSKNWTNRTLNIHSSLKPEGVPNLNHPSVWYHAGENLLYTGFSGWNSTLSDSDNLPPPSIWTFRPDGTGSGKWTQAIGPQSTLWQSLHRPSGQLEAQTPDVAFVLGGHDRSSASNPDTMGGLVQFDMRSRSFMNKSAPCCNATGGIKRGAMHYVPTFGPAGVIIAMGGQNGASEDTIASLIDFSVVSVFDPAKQHWWNQTTTGSPPSRRIEFCTAGVGSTNATYEMYVGLAFPSDQSVLNGPVFPLDSSMLDGTSCLVQQLSLMIPFTSSLCPRSIGSRCPTTLEILDMAILAMLLEATRSW